MPNELLFKSVMACRQCPAWVSGVTDDGGEQAGECRSIMPCPYRLIHIDVLKTFLVSVQACRSCELCLMCDTCVHHQVMMSFANEHRLDLSELEL